jgi:hypothetical protein
MSGNPFANIGESLTTNPVFWLLWLVTAAVCVVAAVRTAIREDQILGFVPVFILAFSYFFVCQAAVVAVTLDHRLQPWMLTVGQGIALVSLLATLWGYSLGSHPSRLPRKPVEYSYKPQSLWYAGILLMVVGIIGQYTFFSAMFAGQADYSVTAYWSLLYMIFYPGLGLCVRVYAGTPEYRTPTTLLLLTGLSMFFMYYWVMMVRRGPMFPFFVIVAYTYYLTIRRVNRAVIVSGLVFVGLLMLFFVLIRDYQHQEGSWRVDQLERVTVHDVILKKAQSEGDNEYLYHCGMIASLIELERFQYCTGYVNLLIHWIPRQWWPDKPTLLDQGWYPRVSNYEMQELLGWQMTFGASSAGVAEAFQQFGWLVPLFWFGLAWVVGRAYAYAYYQPTAARQTLYVGTISVTHWLVSQGFTAAFVPLMFFTVVPLVLMYCFRERAPLTRPRPSRAPAAGPRDGGGARRHGPAWPVLTPSPPA